MAVLTSVHIDGLLAAVSLGTIPIAVFIIITRCQRVCKGKWVTRDARLQDGEVGLCSPQRCSGPSPTTETVRLRRTSPEPRTRHT